VFDYNLKPLPYSRLAGVFIFMKKDTYYFSHDYNAASDYKILYLRQQLGMEGYGIFWYLIEQLAQSGGKLPIKIIPVLAMQMQVTEVKVLAVVNNFELFTITGELFESDRLNRHLTERKSLSDFGKIGAANRWKNRGAINGAIDPPNAKERKGKENKILDTSLENCIKLFLEKTAYNWTKQYATKEAEKFYNFYSAKGWMVGKNKMKSISHAVSGWIARNDKPETVNKPISEMSEEEKHKLFFG
jgi:hypothetical protein